MIRQWSAATFPHAPVKRRREIPAREARPGAKDGLTAATEAQVRAHESGTRRLPDGSYSLHDARGRHQCRLDIGERVCKRAVVEVLAQRPEHDSAKENRPTGFWSKKRTC